MSGGVPDVIQCGDLGELRSRIDRLDREIVRLLAQREAYVVQAARFKKSEADVHAPARVEEVVYNVRLLAQEFGASPDVVEQGYRVLVAGFTAAELVAHGRKNISSESVDTSEKR